MRGLVYIIFIAISALFALAINSSFSRITVIGFAVTFETIVVVVSMGVFFQAIIAKYKRTIILKYFGSRKCEWWV